MIVLLAWLSTARADDDVTLSQVLELARTQAPAILAGQAQVDVASAAVESAGVRSNPSLTYGYSQRLPGANDVPVHTLTLSQAVLLDRQRWNRKQAATGDLVAARAHAVQTTADVEREARQAFVALLAQQQRVTLLDAARADLADIERSVQGRQQAGVVSVYDTERTELEVADLAARLADATAEEADDAAALGLLVGKPGWHPHATGELALSGVDGDADGLWSAAEATLPSLIAARRDEDAAQAWVSVARRARVPIPELGLGVQSTPTPSWLVAFQGSLSMPIPVLDTGKAQVDAAEASAHLATTERESAETEAHATIDAAVEQVRLRRAALDAHQQGAMAKIPEMRQMARDGYANGKFALLELLDAFEAEHAAELTHVDLLEAAMHAEVDALFAAGQVERS